MSMTVGLAEPGPPESLPTQQHPSGTDYSARTQGPGPAVVRLDTGEEANSIVPAKAIDKTGSPKAYLIAGDRTRHVLYSLGRPEVHPT
ncbi:MAG: hypothetical protein J2P45_19310, partial [Candidatus Dormibacteraeota bacterium]|nr:hypothetical protein [Candidatus Dormibacteraeota bacterium]